MFFCLRNTLELDAARPVSDMAAFFGYQPAPSAALTLTLAREHGCISACLQGAEQSFTAKKDFAPHVARKTMHRLVFAKTAGYRFQQELRKGKRMRLIIRAITFQTMTMLCLSLKMSMLLF